MIHIEPMMVTNTTIAKLHLPRQVVVDLADPPAGLVPSIFVHLHLTVLSVIGAYSNLKVTTPGCQGLVRLYRLSCFMLLLQAQDSPASIEDITAARDIWRKHTISKSTDLVVTQ